MSDTFGLITTLANERHMLYRLAARQHLTAEQQQRLSEADGRLPVLWDQYRRELAGRNRPVIVPKTGDLRAA